MRNLKNRSDQQGVYIVEFTLVAGLFFVMLFGAIEVARLFYTWSALDAMTQRGARVAAVCPMNDPAIAQVAIYGNGGGTSTLVPGVTTANINIQYLAGNGNPTGVRNNVNFVQVSIQNYTHQMLIPQTLAGFFAPLLTSPPFTTSLPSESLGKDPGGPQFC